MSESDVEESIDRLRAERRSRYTLDEMVEQEKRSICTALRWDTPRPTDPQILQSEADILDWMRISAKIVAKEISEDSVKVLFALFDSFNDPETKLKHFEALSKIVMGAFAVGHSEPSMTDNFAAQLKALAAARHLPHHRRREEMRPIVEKVCRHSSLNGASQVAQIKMAKLYKTLMEMDDFKAIVGDSEKRNIKRDLKAIIAANDDGDEEDENAGDCE